MSKAKQTLQAVLSQRNLTVDPKALNVLQEEHLVRVWNNKGDLLFYNDAMKKITSYSPLDLCYYDLKTLWRFEQEGFDIFKSIVARALLGQELGKQRKYSVRENQGLQYGASHEIVLAVPLFGVEKIEGVLIAGNTELIKKPA